MGGGLLASLTVQRPLWVGSNQPRKRVDVVGMRKKVEMGETSVTLGRKSKLMGDGEGGQNQTCFITRAVMGSPHTPRPPQVRRESPITLF